MKQDINGMEDIKRLVNTFYGRVQHDDLLGHVFNDVAQVNWEKHLPLMYSFWDTVLFGHASFKGNPIAKHTALNKQTPLTPAHFNRWLEIWHATIDELFEGETAASAKHKADMMRTLMLYKVNQFVQ
jgi:hemoglobin